jgi:peptide deformylase
MKLITSKTLLHAESEGVTEDEWPALKIKLYLAMSNHKKAIGLAAIQIGIKKRAFVIAKNNVLIYFKNPRYVTVSGFVTKHTEGCMSIPKKSFSVDRYDTVKVHDDVNGTQTFNGYLAYVVQHELDHLDGITIERK